MKHLWKLAGISILLTLISMGVALAQFQEAAELSPLPDSLDHYMDEGWSMASLDWEELPQSDLAGRGQLQKLAEAASSQEGWQEIALPYEEGEAGHLLIFKNTLLEEHEEQTLRFSSENAIVYVALDGESIYKHNPEEEGFLEGGESLVELPDEFQNGELWIGLLPLNPTVAASLGEVKIETYGTVMVGLVGNSIADIGCCLLILIMAMVMFVLALIRRYTNHPARGEQFLGLAWLAAGTYFFIETHTLSLFYNIYRAYAMQEYLILLILIFLSMYFAWNLQTAYPRRSSFLLLLASIHGAAQVLLQAFGIERLENMAYVSAAAWTIICAVALASFSQLSLGSKERQALLPALSSLALLAGGAASIAASLSFGSYYVSMAGQYSMALVSVAMAASHTLLLSKEYRAEAEESALLLAEKIKIAEQQNIQLAQAKKDADAARHEALAANKAKGKFLAQMSHEIRTPINAVLGMDEMILRESKESEIKEYAMDIYLAGQTLLSLINDILDFSKIDSGKMEIVPVEYDVSSLIYNLSNMASQRAKDKHIQFQVEVDHNTPSWLYGDDVRIRQVLTNLLTNAVKYTQEGTVWLRLQCLRADGMAKLRFEVEDTGMGIKEEDLPKLTEEFQRIEEGKNRNIEGTGLGMSITVQLLELLGSKLEIESAYGKGSRFSFDLEQKVVNPTPLGDFEARIQQAAETYVYDAKLFAPDAAILVVDDNAVNRKVLRNLLKETQIQVWEAESGSECLRLVQENHYDLIFLDHMMPEMSGIETLHRIKELSHFPCQGAPIVALTANAISGAKESYLSEGFDDFLSKPIIPEKLETMIKGLLPEELLLEPAAKPAEAPPQPNGAAAPEEFLEQLPQVDGLDWHYAWLHLPEIELLEYTVKEFYGQIDSAASQLEQSYGQIAEPSGMEAYRIQVHAMKSLAAMVGILPLAGVAKLLEAAARDGKAETIQSLTAPFLEEWRSYQQKLHGVFGIEPKAKKDASDYSVLRALVEMARISMQEMDIEQADSLIRQLQGYDYPDEINQTVQKLAEAVANLDSEEADRLGSLLIGQMA